MYRPSTSTNSIISVENLNKSFHVGTQDILVLKHITFEVKRGDFTIIFGPSGCGKSTLLHTLLGLEPPTSGKVFLLNQNLYDATTEDDRTDFRKLHVGMVYQQPNWIKSLDVVNNVAFPLSLLGIDSKRRVDQATELLKLVDMDNWAHYHPAELSSGQQQRIALARALITDPELIIADEPTGNLDFESGQDLMKLLQKLNQDRDKTVIMVTHDLNYLSFAKTIIHMFDGQIDETYTAKDHARLLTKINSKRIYAPASK